MRDSNEDVARVCMNCKHFLYYYLKRIYENGSHQYVSTWFGHCVEKEEVPRFRLTQKACESWEQQTDINLRGAHLFKKFTGINKE